VSQFIVSLTLLYKYIRYLRTDSYTSGWFEVEEPTSLLHVFEGFAKWLGLELSFFVVSRDQGVGSSKSTLASTSL
jgi:hypothetical protein